MKYAKILFLPLFFISLYATAQSTADKAPKWNNISFPAFADSKELCEKEPEKVKSLFKNLNLEYPGLEKVKEHYNQDDLPEACDALIAYYKTKDPTSILKLSVTGLVMKESGYHFPNLDEKWYTIPPSQNTDQREPEVDPILDDIYKYGIIDAKIPRDDQGRLDWICYGPEKDVEFAFGLNRHRYFIPLLTAYYLTGNPVYANELNGQVVDWIVNVPEPPEQKDEDYKYNPAWRVLEVGQRLWKSWPSVFFGLISDDHFSSSAAILMLYSLNKQANHLQANHGNHPNHLAMEMSGLAMTGLAWPEFRKAEDWVKYARERVVPQADHQFYPDGSQKELTSHYQYVAMIALEDFLDIFNTLSDQKLPASFSFKNAWNYLAWSALPNGDNLLNNDSDLNRDINENLIYRAKHQYNQPEWLYLMTNGAEGKEPKRAPSIYFPWAGQLIMRSGWDKEAQWGYFDVGPTGVNGHQHYDKLHLSLYAHGRPLLVDNGRFTHRPDNWRQYFISSYSHNVILMDGRGQDEEVETVEIPMETHAHVSEEYDYASGAISDFVDVGDTRGTFLHKRAVCYIKGLCWVVLDRVYNDRENYNRAVQPLWHFHPDCEVEIRGQEVITTDPGKGNLRIVPVADFEWDVRLAKGETDPDDSTRYRMWQPDMVKRPNEKQIQGWYSPGYNKKEPASCAVYRLDTNESQTFAWIMVPAKGDVPEVEYEIIKMDKTSAHIEFSVGNRKTNLFMNFDGTVRIKPD